MSGNLSGAWTQHNHALGEKKYFLQNEVERNCELPGHVQRQNQCASFLLKRSWRHVKEWVRLFLWWHYGCSYNIPIDCFHFLEISINQNWQGFYFQEIFCQTSSLTYLIQHKKCGNRCEFRDWSRASVPLLKIRSDCFRSRCLDKFKTAYNEL